MTEAEKVIQRCSTGGHEGRVAAGEVVLADCDEGSCTGHPYCDECCRALSFDPYNTIIGWTPTPGKPEVPEIIYVEAANTVAALRSLAQRFEDDGDLVLIGLWNIEPLVHSVDDRLQVVVTHLGDT